VSRRRDRTGLPAVLEPVLEALVVGTFLVTFVVQPFRIPTSSMTPTLQVGDCLLMDKQSFAPEGALGRWLLPPSGVRRGELAVFHFPVDPSVHLVKRVIGLPGDRVRLRAGRAVVNGAPLAEPYVFHSAAQQNGFRDDFPKPLQSYASLAPEWRTELRGMMPEGEITVPPGHYFVLGDNRNDSEDSRFWGFVPQSALVGQPLLVYYSVQPGPTWWKRLWVGLKSLRVVR
jgi:signal peptidase I